MASENPTENRLAAEVSTPPVATRDFPDVSPVDWQALYLQAQAAREEADAHVRHLTAVIAGVGDGFVMLDSDLRYTFVNHFTLELMGRTEDEVLGKGMFDLYPTLRGTPYEKAIRKALRERRVAETDLFYPNNGRYWRTRIRPAGDGVTIYFRDVTDLRAAEILQRRLAAIVESSGDAIISKTLDGIITTWNPAAERIFGYTAEEVIGKPMTILFPPELLEEEVMILARLAQGILTQRDESVRVRKDGTPIDVSLTISPVRDGEGNIVGASTIARDISPRKRLERQLKEGARTLETLYEFGQQLAAELDLERLVQTATDVATELTGAQFGAFFYNVVDAAGETYTLYTISGVPRERFASFPMPRNTAVFAPTFAGEATVRSDDITKDPRYGKNAPYHGKPEGHLPVVSYLATPVVSRSGEVVGGLFFGHEQPGVFAERHELIVEGIAAQAAIAIDNARLFQAERERSDQLQRAIREVHHRVKNSLQGVTALLEMQLEPGETMLPVEAVQDALSQIKTIALVHDLLAHDQPVGEVDAAAVLKKLTDMLSKTMGTPDRRLEICLEAVGLRMPVRCATALALVVNELITNAAKHYSPRQPEGGAKQEDINTDDCRIEVCMEPQGEEILLSVQDNGPGFPSGFDPSRHGHIGLELVHTLVTNDLKGDVAFDNRSLPDYAAPDQAQRGARVEILFDPARLSG